MIRAQFSIQLPADLWVTDVSRAFPEATFRLLSGYRTGDTALELGETMTETPEAVVEAIREHPAIAEYELLETDDSRVLGKYETTDTALYEFAALASLPIEFPVDVRDGWYEFDLTGTREELEGFEEILERSPRPYELRSLVRTTDAEGLLTDRQREVLEAAVREGYFEVPRECTLADVADELGVDKSTASTVIRRGQSQVLKWFLTGPGSDRMG